MHVRDMVHTGDIATLPSAGRHIPDVTFEAINPTCREDILCLAAEDRLEVMLSGRYPGRERSAQPNVGLISENRMISGLWPMTGSITALLPARANLDNALEELERYGIEREIISVDGDEEKSARSIIVRVSDEQVDPVCQILIECGALHLRVEDETPQIRNAGPDAMRDQPRRAWDKVDEGSDKSFPASDPANLSSDDR